MKQRISVLVVLMIIAITSGCMSVMPTGAAGAMSTPFTETVSLDAAVCCNSLAEMPFQRLAPGADGEIKLDAESPLYKFSDGRSYFAAFELPDFREESRIKVRSLISKNRVFQPSVLLLNRQFQPVRVFGDEAFPYVPAKVLTPDSLVGEVVLRPNVAGRLDDAKYLIIYSNAQQQSGETTLLHPAKAYAKAKGNEPPNVPDPVAQHSAGGYLLVELESKSSATFAGKLLLPTTEPVTTSHQTLGDSTIAGAEQTSLKILPETAAYYRQQVDQALAADNIDRAMKLAEEAGRLGATEIRSYLLQRLQVRRDSAEK